VQTWQVWKDPAVVGCFAERRRGGLLGAQEQFETMLRLVTVARERQSAERLTVLDLGCGDGVLLETILAAFPGSRGVGLDGSPEMLRRAAERLARFDDVALVEADFNVPSWRERLPEPTFDAVVSGFAIHHSEDERKRELYAEVYDLMSPGGVFVNIEHVASASPLGERLFDEAMVERLTHYRQALGEAVTYEAVMEEQQGRPDKAANRLAPAETQLHWLREIGFADVDCYWKHFELAVLAGFKP
jgi:ubiquinone/menaquinone biosynthesis C-methylase UbiE